MYKLDEKGAVDSRKMIYQGTPTNVDTQVRDIAKYNMAGGITGMSQVRRKIENRKIRETSYNMH